MDGRGEKILHRGGWALICLLLWGCAAKTGQGGSLPRTETAQTREEPAAAAVEYKEWPNPERFEKAIGAFEAADAEAMPPPGGIVAVGSSSMRGWMFDWPGCALTAAT